MQTLRSHWSMASLVLFISVLMGGCQGMNRDDGKAAEAGKAFLAQNAGKPGVITTASGLQYQVLQEGKGLSLIHI